MLEAIATRKEYMGMLCVSEYVSASRNVVLTIHVYMLPGTELSCEVATGPIGYVAR